MGQIRAVIFDFFGTLTPSRSKALRDSEKEPTAACLGIPASDWIRAVDESWNDRVVGADESLALAFQRIACRLNYDPTDEQLAAATQTRLAAYVDSAALRPDALDTLGRLRSMGFKIGLVTDCSLELPAVWHRLPVADLVDSAVFSCIEGTRKPDPILFTAASTRMDLAPTQCLYVGDGGGDELPGASGVGMRAVLFKPQDWAEHDSPDRAMNWTGDTVGSFTELLDLAAGF
jgi:putative hydrolase of the HAD superfamily